jgi:crotonobetainyl-CoA:carnitine CoA-transferase CaiB-like acyl-CoA transferase
MESPKAKGPPLEGIRVLDLADEKASFASKLLAEFGAQVVKIEKPGGDSSRRIGPFWDDSPHRERSLFFLYHNTCKMGITLNLEHEAGREIFWRLVEKADGLIETFPPGYLAGLGLEFERLQKKNPQIILVSVTGFGQDGPRSSYKSCDLIAAAYGGQMQVSGSAATPPLKPYGEQSCYTASLYAAVAFLLALRKRKQTGQGAHIDISLQEVAVSTLEHVMIRYFYDKVVAQRQGSLHWNGSFCILPCKDGHILLTPFLQWETMVEWLDGEGMAGDLKGEKYRQEDCRRQHLAHVLEILGHWTKKHTRAELFELGQSMRFPWAPVQSPADVLENIQLQAREFFREVNHPEMGRSIPYPGPPYKGRHLSSQLNRAPRVGEHNRQIYQEELGLSLAALEKLAEMGAI